MSKWETRYDNFKDPESPLYLKRREITEQTVTWKYLDSIKFQVRVVFDRDNYRYHDKNKNCR
jgi:hypothetical protein